MKKYIVSIIRIMAKGMHSVMSYRRLISLKEKTFYKFYNLWIQNEFGSIGKDCQIEKLRLLAGGKYINIGNKTWISRDVILSAWSQWGGKFRSQSFNRR